MDLLGTSLSAQPLESSGEMEAAARRYSELIMIVQYKLAPPPSQEGKMYSPWWLAMAIAGAPSSC